MNATQIAYATAKAQFDTIAAERTRLVTSIPPDAADYCERVDAIEESLAYWPAKEILLRAEVAMVEWARNVILNNKNLSRRYAEVAPCFDRGMRSVAIRAKVVDLCFRLAA
jgi:hypothetical protein